VIGRAALIALTVLAALGSIGADASLQDAPITYVIRFPEPEHHWMEVELSATVPTGTPVEVRMSRASPGRYAVHEFAKNLFSIRAAGSDGRTLAVERVDPDTWRIAAHDGRVTVTYRIFGDHIDGTYLAIDTTHAHINTPAALLWIAGRDRDPVRLTFEPPPDGRWPSIATQLFPTDDPWTFTAPNLQYLLDSPVEMSAHVSTTFTVESPDSTGPREFRVAAHGDVSQHDVELLAADIARIVTEQAAVFGTIPPFEPGYYTLLLDYVPWADYDAMEHRNSTAISQPGADLSTTPGRRAVLDAIAHELFHIWNVERIRPADLEPFDFTRGNVSCCLWLAEGFTQYYAPLTLLRAGLSSAVPLGPVVALLTAPGRHVRSAVEMSQHATFADAAVSNDPHDQSRTFVSYYTQGAAIALGLDLTLRARSNGQVSLDDYMRRLWRRFGAPAPPEAGRVAVAYTLEDLRAELAAIADETFATEFFARYVEGRDVLDYSALLARAGYHLEVAAPGRSWTGGIVVEPTAGGLLVGGRERRLVAFDTPAYRAGLDAGDVIARIAGEPATVARWDALSGWAVGTNVPLTIVRRDGRREEVVLTLAADPRVIIVPAESGRALTPAEESFRRAWLASRAGH
jgi:predicted metalloprotease with PDZ domain